MENSNYPPAMISRMKKCFKHRVERKNYLKGMKLKGEKMTRDERQELDFHIQFPAQRSWTINKNGN